MVVFLPIGLALAYALYRFDTASDAHAHYEWTCAAYEAETVTDLDLLRAIDECLAAELAVPFADRQSAYAEYLERTASLRRRWTGTLPAICSPEGGEGLVMLIRDVDQRYAESLQQFRRYAGDEAADHLKSRHDAQLAEYLPEPVVDQRSADVVTSRE